MYALGGLCRVATITVDDLDATLVPINSPMLYAADQELSVV